MSPIPLTPRPRVPVLVQATALGTLAFAVPACGDDDGTSTNSSDIHPTAGPCYHQDPPPPECASTGTPPDLTTGTTGTDTGASTAADGATDQHPTAGPCVHDPMAPECASTTDGGSDSGTATESSSGTGTGTGTGSSTTAG